MGDNKSKSEDKNHKRIGWKSWTAIGSLATVGIAFFTALGYFRNHLTSITTHIRPKPLIAAKARYSPIHLPRSYEDALRSIDSPNQISADKEIRALLQKLPEQSRKDAIEAISRYIRLHIPYYLGGTSPILGRIYGWWDIDIENISDVTVYDVVLEIPGYIAVTEVYRKGSGLVEIEEKKDYLRIGDIRPREDVSISAWSTELVLRTTDNKFVLTHKDGVGEVQIE